jgi:O-antigen/teichoic acid export membrane protein
MEGLLLAFILARLPAPRENLAAYGVAFAFAIIVEAPVILLMSASTALVKDAQGYRALWRFTVRLNLVITGLMLFLVIPPVWDATGRLIGLDPAIASRVHTALILLIPWPAAIGDRRFHQGLMIRGNRTGRVAVGTVARVSTMATTAGLLALGGWFEGATVAAAALSVGVITEMIMVRRMVRPILAPLRREAAALGPEVPADLTQRAVFRFYLPLAMTSVIALASQPVITFFMGRAPRPLESLAVLPVLNGLTFIFRALALSYQEVAIALCGEQGENFIRIRRVAQGLFLGVLACLGVIAWTPVGPFWLERIQGLDPELAAFAMLPLRIYSLLPALSVVQSFQRSMLVHGRRTGPMGWATAVELGTLAIALAVLVGGFETVGAVAAAISTLIGRGAGISVLLPTVRRVVARYSS